MQIDIQSDFHMHSRYSDGSGNIDEMVHAAISAGLIQITITDHMPLPFSNRYAMDKNNVELYRYEITQLQHTYSERLKINLGLEMEFIPSCRTWIHDLAQRGWDYLIASIHYLPGRDGSLHLVNGTREEFIPLIRSFGHDGKALCRQYYRILQEAFSTGWFDIVGHLDVVKKHNDSRDLFDESSSWYRTLVLDTLDIIKEQEMMMEINTAGFIHQRAEQYPSTWIIREAMKREIHIVLGSDSHVPDTLGQHFTAFCKHIGT